MNLSIIIPSLAGNKEYLKHCIKSIVNSDAEDYEIIVAGNGDEQTDYFFPIELKEWNVRKLYIWEQGQCRAVNAAVAVARGKYLMISNDDMIYPPDWFSKLGKWWEKDKVWCPVLVEPVNGAPPFIVRDFSGFIDQFKYNLWEEFYKSYSPGQEKQRIETGFNMPIIVSKELWDTVGGYDMNYDPWGSNSDSDLQAKFILAGAKTLRDRAGIVYHFSNKSGTFSQENRAYWDKNWNYFIAKWGFERQPDDQKVWYSKEIINFEKLIFKPEWKDKYANVS